MKLLYALLIFFILPSWSQVMDMNDVTILLPVPRVGQENLLIKSTDLTRSGRPLFMANELFVGFELDVGMRLPMSRQTEGFRVLALRLDHFSGQIYINLVWQKPENGGIYSHAAIHSVHTIQEFPVFLSRMEELSRKYNRVRQNRLPLQVNPTVLAQGFSGAYYQELKKIFMWHINPSERITFRSFRRDNSTSGLAGWELPLDKTKPSVNQFAVIPEFQAIQEPFRNWETYIPENYFFIRNKLFSNILTVGGIPPFSTKNFQPLIEDGERAITMPERELLEMIGRAHMVENPTIIPGVVKTDCMSCHFAQPVRSMTMKLRPGLPYDQFAEKLIYKSTRYNTQNLSPAQRNNITMSLGYVENTAVWNQRVINETAETLDVLYGYRRVLTSVRTKGSH